jgi:hypothetical protein
MLDYIFFLGGLSFFLFGQLDFNPEVVGHLLNQA